MMQPRFAPAILLRLLHASALLLALFAPCGLVRADAAPQAVWFAHAADPQIGYGLDGRARDAERFERLLEETMARGAAFVVIAGDLVQDRGFLQWRAFEQVRKAATLPLYFAAGNHDIVDSASLADYRARMGRDYYAVAAAGVRLVVVDSETARDRTISGEEFEKQWAWLDKALLACRASPQPCILVTHRPPFVLDPTEPEDPRNWPPDSRARLLKALAANGVHTVLAGHLHATQSAHDDASGVTIYSVGGTARVFDEQGYGYRAFELQAGQLQQRYVPLVGLVGATSFLGVEAWTPRIVDPTLRHTLLTSAECLAGGFFLLVAAAWRRRGLVLPRSTGRSLWLLLGCTQLFFGINEQLDFDELALGLLRRVARAERWFDIRHQVGAIVAGLTVLVVIACVLWLIVRAGQARKLAWLPIAGLILPSAWFVLSTLSDHGFGMLFSNDTWDLLLFPSAAISIFAGHRALRSAHAPAP